MELLLKVSIVLIVGFIGGKLARRLKLPDVSGYLVLGIILGPSLGFIFKDFSGVITNTDQEKLKFIGEIALAFIAFSIGSEFNFKVMKKIGKKINTIAVFEVLVAVLSVFVVLFFIPKPAPIMNGYQPFSKNNLAFGLILASMSAATAPAATLMVMRQYRSYGPVTKTVLPVTALDDIYGIVVFGFAISIAQMLVSPSNAKLVLVIFKPFIEVFGSLLLGGIIGYLLSLVVNRKGQSRDDLQIVSMAAVFLIIGLVFLINKSLTASNLVFSNLLANIALGTVLANKARESNKTFKAVNDFTTPFYILFFTLAGASLNLGILKTNIIIGILALFYVLARGFGKYGGAYLGARIAKAEDEVVKYLGLALLPQGGVSLGLLVVVGSLMPAFYPAIATIIMLSILVYETSGPIFAKYALSKAGEIGGLDKLELLSSIEGIEGA
ncbi:MAG TPA: cation:proton antiporter [Acholeplasmataceae bacterium]|nr:cation:proton antiporter [Acholeplasmataceae bacterium]